MPTTILQHSLSSHILSLLRDKTTPPERFRSLTQTVTRLLVAEATRKLPSRIVPITTPLEETPGQQISVKLVAVPILRAGLGMLDAALEMLPDATVGYVGMERDEATAIASAYYCKLPPLENAHILMLDPMLATGGSAGAAAHELERAGAAHITLLCIVAAPEGVAHLADNYPKLHVITAALDRELNAASYILPGLGDFGNRLYGTL